MENIYIENGRLISYTGNETQVIIPEGVTEICSQAFQGNAFVQTISVPDTVTYIGSSAFENCVNLSQINIPLSVTVIPQSMCEGCISLKEIELHECIEDIRFRAFYGCGLETVTIKAEVRVIDMNPFEACEHLKTVDAPAGTVKLLKKYLKGVSYPKSTNPTAKAATKKKELTYVVRYYDDSYKYKYKRGLRTLNEAHEMVWHLRNTVDFLNLIEIVDPYGNLVYKEVPGVSGKMVDIDTSPLKTSIPKTDSDFVIEGNILKKYTGKDATVVIPDGVLKIAEHAFSIDGTIKHIIIPDSVTEIADYFVSVKNRMEAIRSNAARPIIERIDFPKKIKKIPNLDFTILHEMTIPDKLSMYEFQTESFLHIKKLYVRESSPSYKIVDDCVLSKDGKVLYFYPLTKEGECIIPDGVETISWRVFSDILGWGHKVNKIVLPSTVKYIQEYAFRSGYLKEVEVPSSVVSIDKYAFESHITIKGKKDSVAEAYAQENNLCFQEI